MHLAQRILQHDCLLGEFFRILAVRRDTLVSAEGDVRTGFIGAREGVLDQPVD